MTTISHLTRDYDCNAHNIPALEDAHSMMTLTQLDRSIICLGEENRVDAPLM
jgi:predicted restriction endonuclease